MLKPARNSLSTKHLVTAMGVAAAAIVCILFAAIAWVLHDSSLSLDRADTRGEAKLLHSLSADYRKSLSSGVADYSAWTELYRYLQGPRDKNWEKENLGPYIADTFAVDAVLVASRTGRTVYSYAHGANARTIEWALADTGAISNLAGLAFAAEKPGVQRPAAGFFAMNGVPVLAAAASVRDSDARSRSHFALVELRLLTPAALGAIGQQYDIAGLRPAWSGAGIGVRTPQGTPAPFRLAWDPANSGHEMFLRELPVVLAAGLVAFLAFLAIAYVGTRLLARLRLGQQRLMTAELYASHARVQAAEDLAHSKSAFIANMSHELRTPLNAIIGFSDMMRAETYGPIGVSKYREYLEAIHSSGRHLLNVVNDILDLSKIEAGKFRLALQPVSPEAAMREATGVVGPLALKKNIVLDIALDGPNIVADRQALQQVLLNLLTNAIKFSPGGATVNVCAREVGETCEIAVIDSGCGMTEDMLRDIGKPFVQEEGVYSRTNQGTGLGLAISFMLMRAMNGTIAVESKPGAGTTVAIALPKAGEQARGAREAVAA